MTGVENAGACASDDFDVELGEVDSRIAAKTMLPKLPPAPTIAMFWMWLVMFAARMCCSESRSARSNGLAVVGIRCRMAEEGFGKI